MTQALPTIQVRSEMLLRALAEYPELARAEIESTTRRALLGLLDPLSDYPPAVPGSSYVRTGDLGRLWTTAQPHVTVLATGFEGVIGNARQGALFVQGEEQATVHQGRWNTAQAVVDAARPQIEGQYRLVPARIGAAIKRRTG